MDQNSRGWLLTQPSVVAAVEGYVSWPRPSWKGEVSVFSLVGVCLVESGDDFLHQMTVIVGEAEGEFFVIEAGLVEDGGMRIVPVILSSTAMWPMSFLILTVLDANRG